VTPPLIRLRGRRTHRLIPSRYPTAGLLDRVASAGDLDAVIELESWTNDRLSAELGLLYRLPRDEWVVGQPMATVVMAAFCHPRPGGGRFNDDLRGAWYASFAIDTAHAEALYHRGAELAEVGVADARLEMREYRATFSASFHDVRGDRAPGRRIYAAADYRSSQALAARLLGAGSNGIVYDSVRHAGGTCIACFRPTLVAAVSVGAHFEYRWRPAGPAQVRRLR
jgi:RES domain